MKLQKLLAGSGQLLLSNMKRNSAGKYNFNDKVSKWSRYRGSGRYRLRNEKQTPLRVEEMPWFGCNDGQCTT
jgi:hypothetical protein